MCLPAWDNLHRLGAKSFLRKGLPVREEMRGIGCLVFFEQGVPHA